MNDNDQQTSLRDEIKRMVYAKPAKPIWKVLGNINGIISSNPINQTIISLGTNHVALEKLYYVREDPETGEYVENYEESTGAQAFLAATTKEFFRWFGFGEDEAKRKIKALRAED